MKLSQDEIQRRFDNPDTYIKKLREYHERLNMHVHGENLAQYLTQISGLENQQQIKLRQKYARSNKNLFADLLRPTDKIFSAKGGNKEFMFSTRDKAQEFRDKLGNITSGLSLQKWLQHWFLDKYVTDPNGIILIENADGEAWPTYKSIKTIRDYRFNGQRLEYVIFEPVTYKIDNVDVKFVRVYDDEQDKLFRLDEDGKLVLQEDFTYENHWDYVPGFIISDIVNTITGYKKSAIDPEVELADEYLRDASVKTIYKFAHGFPLFWMYLQTCPTCKGEGEIKGKTCQTCNGSGYSTKKDVSDIIGIKPPETEETPRITPDIAGYVTPPGDNLQQMTGELKLLRDMMYHSHWGTVIQKSDNETATGRFIDAQPVNERLNKYADSVENIEKLVVNALGDFYYEDAFKGASINYGRRYIIEAPDQLFDKYVKGKNQGAHPVVQNHMVDQYFQAQFANDNFNLTISRKLYKLDPFPHLDIKDVPVKNRDFLKKLYLNEWAASIKADEIFSKKIKKLDEMLTEYVEQKNVNLNQNGTDE